MAYAELMQKETDSFSLTPQDNSISDEDSFRFLLSSMLQQARPSIFPGRKPAARKKLSSRTADKLRMCNSCLQNWEEASPYSKTIFNAWLHNFLLDVLFFYHMNVFLGRIHFYTYPLFVLSLFNVCAGETREEREEGRRLGVGKVPKVFESDVFLSAVIRCIHIKSSSLYQ